AVLACGGWPAGRGWGAWMGGRGVGRVGGRWRPGSVAPAGVRVRRRHQGRVPGRSGVVAGLVHDDQVAVRPGVVEPPHDAEEVAEVEAALDQGADRKSTRLNSSHVKISYAVFCLKKKKKRSVNRERT